MKYKFKKFWSEWRDLVLIGVGLLLLLSLFLIGLLANRSAKNNPMDSTSEKGIEARSFDYKGHKYILFEKTNVAPCHFKKATRFCTLRQLCRNLLPLSQQL